MIARLVKPLLPPLPEDMPVYGASGAELRLVRSYRLMAFLLCMGAIALLISMSYFLPFLRISPFRLVWDGTASLGGIWQSVISYGLLMICLVFIGPSGGTYIGRIRGKFWDKAAMYEEMWFRSGAENWNVRQRIVSTVAFGFVHIANFIYPLSSLIVVSLVGGVFMLVYLRTFKRTQSTRLATLASTRLHATYNRFALLYVAVAIMIIPIISLIS